MDMAVSAAQKTLNRTCKHAIHLKLVVKYSGVEFEGLKRAIEAEDSRTVHAFDSHAPKISFAEMRSLKTLDYTSPHAFDFATLAPTVKKVVLNRAGSIEWFCIPGIVNGLYEAPFVHNVVIFTHHVKWSMLEDMMAHTKINTITIVCTDPDACMFVDDDQPAVTPLNDLWVAKLDRHNVQNAYRTPSPVVSAVLVGRRM